MKVEITGEGGFNWTGEVKPKTQANPPEVYEILEAAALQAKREAGKVMGTVTLSINTPEHVSVMTEELSEEECRILNSLGLKILLQYATLQAHSNPELQKGPEGVFCEHSES